MLKVSKAPDARYIFLVQQLKEYGNVTIIDNFKEALAILRSSSRDLGAVILYDGSILAATMGRSRLAYQVLECLAEFTRSGGTAVFGPECDNLRGRPSVIDLLEEIWQLRLPPWSCSYRAQFWISPRQAGRVTGALFYYYRGVAEQLFTHLCEPNLCAAQKISEPCKIWGPRYRSRSERFLLFAEHGKGNVGALRKLGSGRDTSRMIFNMLGLNKRG